MINIEKTEDLDNQIARVLAIISYLADKKESCSIARITRELGIKQPTMYRIMSRMMEGQWILKDPKTRKYELGNRARLVAFKMLSHIELQSVSVPYLYELQEKSGETILLSERIGYQRAVIYQIKSKLETLAQVKTGELLPLWYGATGIAMLAFMDANEIEEVLSRSFSKSATRTTATGQVISVDNLRRELEGIRRQGFAVSVGAYVANVAGVASPIFGTGRRVIGAICMFGPSHRFTPNLAIGYGPLVKEAALKISMQMGYDAKDGS